MAKFESPKELAQRIGLSVGLIKRLIAENQIEHVIIGARSFVPDGSFERFIEAVKSKPNLPNSVAHQPLIRERLLLTRRGVSIASSEDLQSPK